MKVAELFAELGFKITGADDLKAVETSLQNIAQAARAAAQAIKELAGVKGPKIAASSSTPAASSSVAPSVAPSVNPNTTATSEPLPGVPPSKGTPTSVLQGFKALGMLGKLAGFTSIAMVLKRLVSGMMDMMRATREATVNVEKFSGQTGVSRNALRGWELAASKVGVSAEEVQNAFKSLVQTQQQIRYGLAPEKASAFSMIGVSPYGAPEDVFYKVGARLKELGPAQAQMFGALTGFSEDWNYFLRQQTERIKSLDQEVLNDRQQSAVTKLNSAWVELTFTLERVRDKIVADIAPGIESMLHTMTSAVSVYQSDKARAFSYFAPAGLSALPAAVNSSDTSKHYAEGLALKFAEMIKSAVKPSIEQNVKVEMNAVDKESGAEAARVLRRELNNAYYSRPVQLKPVYP